MTENRRDRMRVNILATARYGMGEVTNKEIDRLGLGEARRLVFERALDDFASKYGVIPDHIIVDGTLYRPWREVPYTLEPRADDNYACVSAASVLAKTTRDRQVVELCDGPGGAEYAPYGIRRNKGYLSKQHIDAIGALGRTSMHRHSYNIRSLNSQRTNPTTSPPIEPAEE
jgi:ribonuclease HII